MFKTIRLAIFQAGFNSQADFSQAAEMHESTVCRILKGRRKLSKLDAAKWIDILKCEPQILAPVTKDE